MESDYTKLIELIKQIVMETNAAAVMADVVIGEVIATGPLRVRIENKYVLESDDIVLTKNTSDWSVDMTVDHQTEDAAGGSGYAEYASHHHGYAGRKTYLVHNALAVGDKVILLRESGGQRFIAIDRYDNPNRGCSD